jgi:ABC-type Zn uptake system ZnuABC Zn-binding protein ZnuA
LLRDAGFAEPVVLTGGEAHEDLSAGEVAALIAELKKTRPAAVLVEKQSDPRVARMVAQEIGAPLVTLDVGLGGPAGPDAFLGTMQRLAVDLQSAWSEK